METIHNFHRDLTKIDCTGRDGLTRQYYYFYDINEGEERKVYDFRVLSENYGIETFEILNMAFTETGKNELKCTAIYHHNDTNFIAKGIPEALILEVSEILGKKIISSTNHPNYKVFQEEFRTDPATKMWNRLVTKKKAVYDSDKDLYSIIV